MATKTILDLFCGAGGFSLGAHLAGFSTVGAVDIDSDLSSKYEANFPTSKLMLRDLAACRTDSLLRSVGKEPGEITGVIGGPPCQGFSPIGKRQADDPRNHLIGHFYRHVAAIDPTFFVMENVPGILEPDNLALLMKGIDRLGGKFHIIGPIRLNAWDFGAATHRERVVVVGIKPNVRGIDSNVFQKSEPHARPTVFEAIHDLPEPGVRLWRKYSRDPESGARGQYARNARLAPTTSLGDKSAIDHLRNGKVSGFTETIHSAEVLERFAKIPQGKTETISRCPRLSWDKPCTTLRAGTGKERGKYQSIRPIHPRSHRVITVREAARLQGFPDWFQFHETKWHSFRMIGNSVSPKLSQALLSAIAAKLS